MEKVCSRCGLSKDIELFNKCNKCLLGKKSHCKSCQKETRKLWYIRNKENQLLYSKRYSKTDKAIIARKLHYQLNVERIRLKNNERRKSPEAKAKARLNQNNRYRSDEKFRLKLNLRTRIRKALKGINKSRHTLDLLGCSLERFKIYLESKFQDGMTWENYGYKG